MATATKKKPGKNYKCSCGLAFGHIISLRRHLKATGHDPDVLGESTPAAAAPTPEPDLREHEEEDEETLVAAPAGLEPEAPAEPSIGLLDLTTGLLVSTSRTVDWAARQVGQGLGRVREQAATATSVLEQSIKLAAGMLCVLVCLGIVLLLGSRSLAWGRTAEPATEPAAATVAAFYQALSDQRLDAAYGLLSPQWRHELSREAFRGGTPRGSLTSWVERVEPLGSDRVRVEVLIWLHRGDGRSVSHRQSHLVVLSDEGWRLDRTL